MEAYFLLLYCSFSLSRPIFLPTLLQLQPYERPISYYFTAASATLEAHFLLLNRNYSLSRGLFLPSGPEHGHAEVSNFTAGAKVGNLALPRDLSFTGFPRVPRSPYMQPASPKPFRVRPRFGILLLPHVHLGADSFRASYGCGFLVER